jgi:hypothetical protein
MPLPQIRAETLLGASQVHLRAMELQNDEWARERKIKIRLHACRIETHAERDSGAQKTLKCRMTGAFYRDAETGRTATSQPLLSLFDSTKQPGVLSLIKIVC